MKKFFTVMVIFALVLGGCGDDSIPDNGSDGKKVETTLKINNQSNYDLLQVDYAGIDFGNVNSSKEVEKNVETGTRRIFFFLQSPAGNVRCRTVDVITCEEEKRNECIVINNTQIETTEGNKSGSLKSVYEELNIVPASLLLNQGSILITNNSVIPFDFGQVLLGESKSLAFTIHNPGTVPLGLTGNPLVESSNSVFIISSQPSRTINPDSSANFVLRYTPTVEKMDTSTITIVNDSESALFAFTVQGNGHEKKPQMTIKKDNNIINQSGEYDFGSILIGNENEVTFTIGNSGEENLSFVTINENRINLSDNTNGFFSVSLQPSASTIVTPGNYTTFVIKFSPTLIGTNYSALVNIQTNSRDDSDFSFRIKGNGRSYLIGDNGPGGGIVFFVAGNQFMECSGELGKVNYYDAEALINNYKAGGFTDWYLPSRGNFELMAQNLYNNSLGDFFRYPETYWTTDERLGYKVYVYVNSSNGIGDGNSYSDEYRRVRAVRSFTFTQ